jgi:hypothetical protein
MFATLGICLFGFLILLGSACESKSSTRQEPAPRGASQTAAATTNPAQVKSEMKTVPVAGSSSGPASLDACTLIDKSEIASTQGVEVQQTQPTTQLRADLNISQCYYTAISPDGSSNLSVFLQVIQRNPQSARHNALREFWEEKIARARTEKRTDERDEEEAINPPLHVSGVGDEAFWLGNSRGGALFVLKKNRLVRVSVGDADAKVQIEKSKTLARKALARLG